MSSQPVTSPYFSQVRGIKRRSVENESKEETKKEVVQVDTSRTNKQDDDEVTKRPTKKLKKESISSTPAAQAASSVSSPSSSSSSSVRRGDPSILSFPPSHLTAPIETYSSEVFDPIARRLMTDYHLYSNGHLMRILEIELYWKGDLRNEGAGVPSIDDPNVHHDIFAHGHPIQKNNFGTWYFHRQGTKPDASFKGGSYKGMDVTFGCSTGGGHGGVLIRTVQQISTGEIIEGPCRIVDEVLRQQGVDSLVALHQSWKGNTSAFTNPTLYFVHADSGQSTPPSSGQPILIKSPRVGLTLKQDGATRPKYIMKPYRYTAVPCVQKKWKPLIAMSAYEELGLSQLSTVCTLSDCTPAQCRRWIDSYESGKKLGSLAKFLQPSHRSKNLSQEELIQMYGAWMSVHGGKSHVGIIRA